MVKRLIFDIDGILITGIDFKVFVKNALQKFNIYSEQNVEKFLFAIIPKANDELLHILEELSTKYELVLLSNYFQESQMNRLNNMKIGHLFTEYHGEKITNPNRQAYYNWCA